MARQPVSILYLNHNFEGEGTFLRCFNIAKHITEAGSYAISLVTTSKESRFHLHSRQVNRNLRIITLPRFTKKPSYLGYLVRGILSSMVVLGSRYDALHSFAVAIPTTACPTLGCRWFRGKPIIIDWDDAWSGGYATYVSSFANWLTTFFEYKTPKIAGASAMTVCSEVLRRMAVERIGMDPGRVFKVLNGANSDIVYPIESERARAIVGIRPDEKVVMAMGRTFTKSFEILLDVFSRVHSACPSVRLVIVGELCDYGKLGSYIGGVKDRFRALIPCIQFAGRVPYGEIKYYLSAADVLALPMEDSIHDWARFPIRLGDYMASGRPIVSNAVGELRRILLEHKAGTVVDVNDLGGFSEGILAFLRDNGRGCAYGANALRAAREEMDWAAIAREMIEVYRSVGIR
jgi:glycosyltransferase involved in cell wall biosynthesis